MILMSPRSLALAYAKPAVPTNQIARITIYNSISFYPSPLSRIPKFNQLIIA